MVKEAKKHHLVSYVWQNGGYTMFGVSILDVGKLEAIRYICRKKGVSISSVMAFGNHGNDVDLLASCGYGVAMKNGSAQAKKAAKYISDYANNEQGVLRFINSFFV